MSFNLASSILRGTWIIDPAFARAQMPFLVNILKGNTQFDAMSDEEKEALNPINIAVTKEHIEVISASSSSNSNPNLTADTTKFVRIIPVVGVMVKYSQDCGPRGTVDMGRQIEVAGNDSAVDAVVIKFDTPGGMVAGIQNFSGHIKEARKKKPVVAFVDDGLCCSAGYWAASNCNEIIASQKTDVIGSIGVYITLGDFKGYFEKQGIKIHEIYADQSSEKNSAYRDAMKGNYKKIKNNDLNPIAQLFATTVKDNRGDKLNLSAGDPFKGDTFMADRALEMGLIDSIGNLEFAVRRAAELSVNYTSASAENSNKNLLENDMKMKILSSQSALAALLAVSFAQGETEKEVELTADHLVTINNKLVELEASAKNANDAKVKAEADLVTANAKITELEAGAAGTTEARANGGAEGGGQKRGSLSILPPQAKEGEEKFIYDY